LPNISDINGVAVASLGDFNGVAKASITDINGVTLVAAAVSAPAAAYSVRLLGSAVGVPTYTGACMRIRRDTAGGTGDDDEADVAFDTSLSTPTISLDSAISNASSGVTATTFGEFVAASGYSNPDSLSGTILAYVDTWMDQSGNGVDAEQSTHLSQPQIYDGSNVIQRNSLPTLDFDGVNDHLTTSSQWLSGTVGRSIIAIGGADTANLNETIASISYQLGAASGTGFYFTAEIATRVSGRVVFSEDFTSANLKLAFYTLAENSNVGDGTLFLDGSSVSQSSSTTTSINTTDRNSSAIGVAAGTAYDGVLSELIVYASDESSNRSGIETDINNYFSI